MKTKSALAWIAQVLCWVLLLSSAAVLLAAVLVPRLTHATPYTITTGSMKPTLPPGTLAVVKPVDATKLQAGDIITYQLKSGEAAVVTHRIVGVGTSLNNETFYRTQGDANAAPDELLVRPVQVRGEVWYHLPYVGYASQTLSTDQRHWVTNIIVGALFLYAAWQFWSYFRDRRRRTEEPQLTRRAWRPRFTGATLTQLAVVGVLMSCMLAALFVPSGAYWQSSQIANGTTVTADNPFYCRVINVNSGATESAASCNVELGTSACNIRTGSTAEVYLAISGTGVNGQGNNRAIQFRTSLKAMGCNPPGVNWTSPTAAGLAGGPLFTFTQPFTCANLPIVQGQIGYANRGPNVRLGTLYFNRSGQTVSCT